MNAVARDKARIAKQQAALETRHRKRIESLRKEEMALIYGDAVATIKAFIEMYTGRKRISKKASSAIIDCLRNECPDRPRHSDYETLLNVIADAAGTDRQHIRDNIAMRFSPAMSELIESAVASLCENTDMGTDAARREVLDKVNYVADFGPSSCLVTDMRVTVHDDTDHALFESIKPDETLLRCIDKKIAIAAQEAERMTRVDVSKIATPPPRRLARRKEAKEIFNLSDYEWRKGVDNDLIVAVTGPDKGRAKYDIDAMFANNYQAPFSAEKIDSILQRAHRKGGNVRREKR
jgi:hypothetical protein